MYGVTRLLTRPSGLGRVTAVVPRFLWAPVLFPCAEPICWRERHVCNGHGTWNHGVITNKSSEMHTAAVHAATAAHMWCAFSQPYLQNPDFADLVSSYSDGGKQARKRSCTQVPGNHDPCIRTRSRCQKKVCRSAAKMNAVTNPIPQTFGLFRTGFFRQSFAWVTVQTTGHVFSA